MTDPAHVVTVRFHLNGRAEQVEVPTSLTLTDLLRDRFGLSGVKFSCSRGVCGVCTVLVDGDPVASCSQFSFQIEGRAVQTIEGLRGDVPHAVQRAFTEHGGFQCGYCTPGMVLTAKALLDRNAAPDRAEVVEWMSSNVCRCTGYEAIVESVLAAAEMLRRQPRA
ncbi:MAG: aerobic-type carbon monoxide dehydrogenase, small subunit CoxS/CutS-like protein [Ramlibacter sp.]|jgi:carbon-monoxide dehydrogenase small subunit|uniref:(2Fe-2S)-binding protein n=1 Tax=Ramlibacter sp. TaxID=1917967 RepID=UPI00260D90FA|nr:(2Fe-2S)-binding protein [Ramlibacter sp.]MDB5753073.1 aerobic-type carbon monoxide dehydrogenase, small subunit CoxS/CutS-like protein [Ramlibacter sp.]